MIPELTESQTSNKSTTEEPQGGTQESTTEESQASTEAPSEEPKPQPEDELPDWAKSELSKVRGEAANYRVRLREAEARLSAAKTPEEVDAAIAGLREQNAALEREVLVGGVARAYGLPDVLAERLRGATKAELEADAKELQRLVGTHAPSDLSGGLDPSDKDDGEMDPGKLARQHGRRRR